MDAAETLELNLLCLQTELEKSASIIWDALQLEDDDD